MRVLVVGQGGREHALVRALHLSPSVTEVHAAPGSDGMRAQALVHPEVLESDVDGLVRLGLRLRIDLVVVGPEGPLVLGLSDALRKNGFVVFGPSQQASMLEGSKIFAKEFLQEHFIPTARSVVVDSVAATLREARNFDPPWVLKADGLAAGKGVSLHDTLDGLKSAGEALFDRKELGEAGKKALLEEFMPGYELSYLVLTNGKSYETLPVAQDHKRLLDGDRGPNTGGMGCVAPIRLKPALEQEIRTKIMSPLMAGFQIRGFDYRGVLYVGLMVNERGPRVVEFNCRFGDPETQVILPLLDGDWGQVLMQIGRGVLPERIRWRPLHAACVVMASEGYPHHPVRGSVIKGDLGEISPSCYVLHAGARQQSNVWTTAGGRVLNAVGLGSTLPEALGNAYSASDQISWSGLQKRMDIGKQQIGQ